MFIDLHKTLRRIKDQLPEDKAITFKMLERAYDQTLRLRNQILAVMYDMLEFGSTKRCYVNKLGGSTLQTENEKMVTLVIPEPLPAKKELSDIVEKHWIQMIHEEIARISLTGIPYFQKAFVMIRITAPRGSRNHQVWDTSNRAINVIINNLKGIFFDDDNFEHMACCIVADWGEPGRTEIRICELENLRNHPIFSLESKNP